MSQSFCCSPGCRKVRRWGPVHLPNPPFRQRHGETRQESKLHVKRVRSMPSLDPDKKNTITLVWLSSLLPGGPSRLLFQCHLWNAAIQPSASTYLNSPFCYEKQILCHLGFFLSKKITISFTRRGRRRAASVTHSLVKDSFSWAGLFARCDSLSTRWFCSVSRVRLRQVTDMAMMRWLLSITLCHNTAQCAVFKPSGQHCVFENTL